jgi:hypothetical protein
MGVSNDKNGHEEASFHNWLNLEENKRISLVLRSHNNIIPQKGDEKYGKQERLLQAQ